MAEDACADANIAARLADEALSAVPILDENIFKYLGRMDELFDDSYSAWQIKGIVDLLKSGTPDAIVKGLLTNKKWGISRATLKAGRNRTVDEYADCQIHRAKALIEMMSRMADYAKGLAGPEEK